jgi:hypothetical protein
MDNKPSMSNTTVPPVPTPMGASGGAVPTYSSGSHQVRAPPTEPKNAQPPPDKVKKPKGGKEKKKKKKKKKTVAEKVPLMGKVKQAKMAHQMTKGKVPTPQASGTRNQPLTWVLIQG